MKSIILSDVEEEMDIDEEESIIKGQKDVYLSNFHSETSNVDNIHFDS